MISKTQTYKNAAKQALMTRPVNVFRSSAAIASSFRQMLIATDAKEPNKDLDDLLARLHDAEK